MSAEERASGIAPDEPTEVELMLEDLLEREADHELNLISDQEKEKRRKEKEKKDAEEIRNVSLETMGETSNRRGKKRKSSCQSNTSEVIEFLSTKCQHDRELKEREIAVKERELDIRERELAMQKECMEKFLYIHQTLLEKLVEKLG